MVSPLARLVALARAKPMLAAGVGVAGLAMAVPVVGRLRQPAIADAGIPANGVATARPLPGDPGDLFASERAMQNAGIVNAIAAQTNAILGAARGWGSGTGSLGGAPGVAGPAVTPVPPAPGIAPTPTRAAITTVPLPIGPVATAARIQPTPVPVPLAAAPLAPLPPAPRNVSKATIAARSAPPPPPPKPAVGVVKSSISVPSPAPKPVAAIPKAAPPKPVYAAPKPAPVYVAPKPAAAIPKAAPKPPVYVAPKPAVRSPVMR